MKKGTFKVSSYSIKFEFKFFSIIHLNYHNFCDVGESGVSCNIVFLANVMKTNEVSHLTSLLMKIQ